MESLIIKLINTFKYSSIYKHLYNNIITYKYKNYIITSLLYILDTNITNLIKIKHEDCFFIEHELIDISDPNLKMYVKLCDELVRMFNNDYYTNSSNITVKYSMISDEYILTPTTRPIFDDDIIVINNTYSAYNFYHDNHKKLFEDMFNIYSKLIEKDNTFILLNSLEVGSLPDIFHFHIYKNKFSIEYTNENLEFLIDEYYKVNESSVFSNSYLFKNICLTKLNKIRKSLYLSRNYNNYIYKSQLYFITLDGQICLLITFRKVNHMFIDNKPQYYLKLFGKMYEEKGLIYLPYGIIITNNKISIEELHHLIDSNEINDIKKNYVHNDYFERCIKDELDNDVLNYNIEYEYTKNNEIISTDKIGLSYKLYKYINNTIIPGFNKYINIISDDLTLDDFNKLTIKQSDDIYNILLFDEEYSYIIKDNDIVQNIIFNQILQDNENVLPYFYCKIQVESKIIYIFEGIRYNTLIDFIHKDADNIRRDNNLILYFCIVIKYYIDKKYINYELNLDDCLITYNSKPIIDYVFSTNTFITVCHTNTNDELDNNKSCIYHYNHDIKINPNKLLNSRGISQLDNYFEFCHRLNQILGSKGVSINSFDESNKLFNNKYNIFSHKTDTYFMIDKIWRYKYSNTLENPDNSNNPDKHIKYEYIKESILNNKQVFITGMYPFTQTELLKDDILLTVTDNTNKTLYDIQESQIFTRNESIYFIKFDKDSNDFFKHIEQAIYHYIKSDLFSYNNFHISIYKLKKQKKFYIISETFNHGNYSTSQYTDILYPILNNFMSLINFPLPTEYINRLNPVDKLTYCQQLLYFICNIIYYDNDVIGGTTSKLEIDKVIEYVVFNPNNTLSLSGILKLSTNNYYIFYNYNLYLDALFYQIIQQTNIELKYNVNDENDMTYISSQKDKLMFYLNTNILQIKDQLELFKFDPYNMFNRPAYLYADSPNNFSFIITKKYKKYKLKYLKKQFKYKQFKYTQKKY